MLYVGPLGALAAAAQRQRVIAAAVEHALKGRKSQGWQLTSDLPVSFLTQLIKSYWTLNLWQGGEV